MSGNADPIIGVPGFPTGLTASYKRVRAASNLNVSFGVYPTPTVIDPALCRDIRNTSNLGTILAGMPYGKVTSGGKLACSIIGVTSASYTSGATSLTLSAATAVELARRVGTSGTFKLVGPPSAAGTVVVATVTYSAVNTSTGVATVTDIGANKISGCIVVPTDGSEFPVGVQDDGFGLTMVDLTGTSLTAQQFGSSGGNNLLESGYLDVSQLAQYPTDTSLIAWYRAWLNGTTSLALLGSVGGGGVFRFTDAA
jgi:alkylated DNA nucleotide flippase Atl1